MLKTLKKIRNRFQMYRNVNDCAIPENGENVTHQKQGGKLLRSILTFEHA